MIFDCILFNDEIDILKLRLAYLSKHVDFFLIGESTRTYSGQSKPLYFLDNKNIFSEFENKVIHTIIPAPDDLGAWGMEYYQRNFLKNALRKCSDDDLIIIADVDEIVDINLILHQFTIDGPHLIEMNLYYYFLNLKTKTRWCKTLVSPYKFIKDFNIGNRDSYWDLTPTVIQGKTGQLGWHFSYVFGYNHLLYISKLTSFSHQEYNTPYFLNSKRIMACVKQGVDFLERNSVYDVVDINAEFPAELLQAMHTAGLTPNYIYKSPGPLFYLDTFNFKYFIKFKIKPVLKRKLVSLKLLKDN